MKKISYYILFIVIIGGVISLFWVYQRYFKEEKENILSFEVVRGDIEEVVKVRGEAVSQKEFDLEFPSSGIVENVFVKEGQFVALGAPLMKLETINLELEVDRLEATLSQAQASLNKLISGATEEDIKVSETKVNNAKEALEDAKKDLVNKLRDAFSKSDDAIRNKADQLFSNPRSSNPQINVTVSDNQLKTNIETRRLVLEKLLTDWGASIETLSISSKLDDFTIFTNKNFGIVQEFLDRMALLVNGLSTNSSLSQTTIDGYKSDIWTARTNINTAITNLTASEEKLSTAKSGLTLAERELSLKITGAREEDIEIANAQIKEIKSKIAIVKEKIKKSTLYAPGAAKIEKVWFEKHELFRVGNTAISLSAFGIKIQSDVSELEIGKIKEGNGNVVLLEFDAFPKEKFVGKVVSIEPRKVVKDGDTYYKINIYLDKYNKEIRAGMSADLTIKISSKENVLKIPEFAVYKKDGKDVVIVTDGGVEKEVEVNLGISDGEFVEIISGLTEGQVVVVPAD
jgi:multidrug efflux pump subunit AcrA (membrane-fusion protein)